MCIILTCEKSCRPDSTTISTCFSNNPDGAGIMWVEDGRVQTSKGFMDKRSLEDAIESVPMDSPLVIHMRIATSGGIDVGTCHPFPVSRDVEILHAPDVECNAAVMHNGVILGEPTDDKHGISDTVHFVSHTIADMWRKDNHVTRKMRRRIMDEAPGNRFAILTSDGTVYRLGHGWESVSHGIEASNGTWRYTKHLYYDWGRYADGWGYSDGWDCWGGTAYDDMKDFETLYEAAIDDVCGGCPHMWQCKVFGVECAEVADYLDAQGLLYNPEGDMMAQVPTLAY